MLIIALACAPSSGLNSKPGEEDCDASTFYADADADSFGDAAVSESACEAPEGYVADATDCDDAHAEALPGGAEVCDGLDNDCNGAIDDDASDVVALLTDADRDGAGNESAPVSACPGAGYASVGGDCDDARADVNPAAPEVCDLADNNCDGATDEGFDADADGFPADTACAATWGVSPDCDDTTADALPGGAEVCNDGLDNDCDGTGNACGFDGASDLSTADLVWRGEHDGDLAGTAFAMGDAAAELAIGAPLQGGYGSVYVVPADTAGAFDLDDAPVRVDHADAGAEGGYAVTLADLDDNGVDDLIMGAPGDASTDDDAGAAFVFRGPLSYDTDFDEAVGLFGARKEARAGSAVAAGDLTGDGALEILVGAWGQRGDANYGGAVYAIPGNVAEITDLEDAGTVFFGKEFEDFAGWSVAAADVDGDGTAEMLVGVPGDDAAGGLAGAVGIVTHVAGTLHEADADAWLTGGSEDGDGAGHSIVTGDWNGDGHVDVAAGAPESERAGIDVGAALVAFGPFSGTRAMEDVVLLGTSAGAHAGSSTAAGDFDGDGDSDLAVGAPYEGSGVVYVLAGPLASGTLEAATVQRGAEADATMAGAAIFGGDVSGDGGDDLVVFSSGEDEAGASWVIWGGGR